MSDTIILPKNEDFKFLKSGQLSYTVTENITRNTFASLASESLGTIPVNRIYPLVYCADQSIDISTRRVQQIPDQGIYYTVDGAGGLADGTLIAGFPEWKITSGTIYIGHCPSKWAGGNNTQTLKAPYPELYFTWFIFYL